MGKRLGIKGGVYKEKQSNNASLFNCKTQNEPTSRNYYIQKLEQKLQGMDYDEFNEWLKSIGLLHNNRNCDSCGEPMRQQKAKGRQ
jgi:hypothetical protein